MIDMNDDDALTETIIQNERVKILEYISNNMVEFLIALENIVNNIS